MRDWRSGRTKIAKRRAAAGYQRLSEFAALCDMTPNHVGQVEAGKRPLSRKLADKYSKLCGITIEEFRSLVGPPARESRSAGDFQLRVARESRGVTMREIAEKSGYSVAHISHLETGKAAMFFDMAKVYADLLCIPVEEILFLSASKTKKLKADRKSKPSFLKQMRIEHFESKEEFEAVSGLMSGTIDATEAGATTNSTEAVYALIFGESPGAIRSFARSKQKYVVTAAHAQAAANAKGAASK